MTTTSVTTFQLVKRMKNGVGKRLFGKDLWAKKKSCARVWCFPSKLLLRHRRSRSVSWSVTVVRRRGRGGRRSCIGVMLGRRWARQVTRNAHWETV